MEIMNGLRDYVYIGKCNYLGALKVFGIKNHDRRQHMYILGKTGVGKTVLMKNLALQDIMAGRGVAIIDPHGDFSEEILSCVPPERVYDVVYFNPTDEEFTMGLNIFEAPDSREEHLALSHLMGVFKKYGKIYGIRTWNLSCKTVS